MDDLMTNPAREDELRRVVPDLFSAILERENDDPLKQMFVETYLESKQGEAANYLLEVMRQPAQRAMVTGVVAKQLDSPPEMC